MLLHLSRGERVIWGLQSRHSWEWHRIDDRCVEVRSATLSLMRIQEELNSKIAGVPMKRMRTPDDEAKLVAFLASEAEGFMTGHVSRLQVKVNLKSRANFAGLLHARPAHNLRGFATQRGRRVGAPVL
jgi:hypothetical protein